MNFENAQFLSALRQPPRFESMKLPHSVTFCTLIFAVHVICNCNALTFLKGLEDGLSIAKKSLRRA